MKDYLLLLDENEKLKRIINAYEFYDDEIKSTTPGERVLTFKMNDSVVDIENGNKIGVFVEGKFDLFIVDQVEAETYYSTSIKVTCLHDFYSIQTQKAITQYHKDSVSINDAMTEMLKGTSYELGECVERALMPIGPYLFKNPLWCIQDIISNFRVEIDFSIELNETRTGIARKLVHVVNALGSDTGIRCSTDLNVSKIKRIEKDKFYTVMYGCGAEYQKDLVKYKYDFKDISWSTSNGNPTDKPTGQEFVEDKKAIAKYGRIIGIFEDGRIKDPELLLKKTWEALQKNNRPIVSYELDIEELKTEDGYEHLNFKLGDIIILQNTIDNSRAKFRIVEDCKSIRNKNKRKVTVGEQLKGIFSGGNSGNSNGTEGPGGNVIDPGGEEIKLPSIEEITPDTLPEVPVVTVKGLWKTVQLSWTYESKMYYNYEVYASRIKDFEPTIFHMIYSGKASAFLHETGPNETWYYRVRAVNTFGNATQFSEQVEACTTKVSDGTQYFESAAIKDALIETLRLDRGWIGELDATYLSVKGKFTVIDGNDEETFKIGSFGEVIVKPSVFTLLANCVTNVPTKPEVASAIGVANSYTDTQVNIVAGQIREKVSKTDYDTNNQKIQESILEISKRADGISQKVSNIEKWESSDVNTVLNSKLGNTSNEYGFGYRKVRLERGKTFTLTANGRVSQQALNDDKKLAVIIHNDDWTWSKTIYIDSLEDTTKSITFTAPDNGLYNIHSYMYPQGGSRAGSVTVNWYKNVLGNKPSLGWSPSPNDIDSKFNEQSTEIEQLSNEIKHKVDDKGVQSIITQSGSQVINAFNSVNPNVQNNGKFIIKNGMFEIWNSQNARSMYIADSGLVASNTGFGTYKSDGSGLHMTGNVLLHVPPPSGNYEELHIESNLPIKFKTGLWGSQQAVQYQRVITSGVMLDGTAWNPNGVQLYILSADAEGDTVVLYNQYKQLTMNLTARNIECQQLTVAGAKNRIVKTENYGIRKLNAVETCECYFEDRGKGSLVNGRCRIDIDRIFSETVNLDDYDVSITKYGRGDIWVSERHDTYFIVEGENDIEFSYILYAKQKGYENERLEIHESDYKEVTMIENQMFKENVTYKELEQGNAWKLYRK